MTNTAVSALRSARMGHRDDQPAWAVRGPRSIPKLEVPRLCDTGLDLMAELRPIAVRLIIRPFVALVAFVGAVSLGWWWSLPFAVWAMYGSTLAAVHHLLHGGLGLTPRWRHIWLTVLGCLVVESGHALLATHTAHHRDGSDVPDPESYIEYLSWRELPVGALKYRYRLAWWGWTNGTNRRRIGMEMIFHPFAYLVSVALLPFDSTLVIYLMLIHVASFAFAVLQAKGPQANWGRSMNGPLMFVNTRLLAVVFFRHHQHLEHHAYPKVPLERLPLLRTVIEDALAGEDVANLDLLL